MSEENRKSKRFILIGSAIINTEKVNGFKIDEIGDKFRVMACFSSFDLIVVGEFDSQAEAINLMNEISQELYFHQ